MRQMFPCFVSTGINDFVCDRTRLQPVPVPESFAVIAVIIFREFWFLMCDNVQVLNDYTNIP